MGWRVRIRFSVLSRQARVAYFNSNHRSWLLSTPNNRSHHSLWHIENKRPIVCNCSPQFGAFLCLGIPACAPPRLSHWFLSSSVAHLLFSRELGYFEDDVARENVLVTFFGLLVSCTAAAMAFFLTNIYLYIFTVTCCLLSGRGRLLMREGVSVGEGRRGVCWESTTAIGWVMWAREEGAAHVLTTFYQVVHRLFRFVCILFFLQ